MTTLNPTLQFLDALYDDAEGYAVIGAKNPWREKALRWPRERERTARLLLNTGRNTDVYAVACLQTTERRTLGGAVSASIIHCDVDHGQLDPDLVRELGGWAVASGSPGNGHCYLRLAEPVPVWLYQELCRAWGAFLCGADAKISPNDMLRVPGTANHKTDPPRLVDWLLPDPGVVWPVADLAERLGVATDAPPEAAVAVSSASDTTEPVPARPWPYAVTEAYHRSWANDGAGNLSRLAWGLARACRDAGWSPGQALAVAMTHQPTLAHFGSDPERIRADIARAYAKPGGAR